MTRPAYIHIDTDALVHNLACVRKQAPNSRVMAVIKANAYGCGIEQAGAALQAVSDAFAVCSIEEALTLRNTGITIPILLLEGFFQAEELSLICDNDLEIVVHHQAQVNALTHTELKKPVKIWLKLNTGMNRLGLLPEQFKAAWNQLNQSSGVMQPICLMTHFACADFKEDDITLKQIKCFEHFTKNLPGERSLANSAGILAWPQSHCDWVRPGIMLYGVSPFAEQNGYEYGLKPVMSFYSQLIAIQSLKKGDAIGYGRKWVCPEDMKIGVVACGYGDGYPRHAPNGTPVFVNEKRASLVGCVSMDMLTVNLCDHPDAKIGDHVELWGKKLPVEEIARHAGTIGYELLCQVTNRVRVSQP